MAKVQRWPTGQVFDALEILAQAEVWSVSILGQEKPLLHVGRETLLRVAQTTGEKPDVSQRSAEFWEARIDTGAYVVLALFKPEDLPMIGYQVVHTASVLVPLAPPSITTETEEGARHG